MIELLIIVCSIAFIIGYGIGRNQQNDELVEAKFDLSLCERIKARMAKTIAEKSENTSGEVSGGNEAATLSGKCEKIDYEQKKCEIKKSEIEYCFC